MLWLQRIEQWWRVIRDPAEKAKRKQFKRSQRMAKFLEKNRESEENSAEGGGSDCKRSLLAFHARCP